MFDNEVLTERKNAHNQAGDDYEIHQTDEPSRRWIPGS
jgi:hypothetical protein